MLVANVQKSIEDFKKDIALYAENLKQLGLEENEKIIAIDLFNYTNINQYHKAVFIIEKCGLAIPSRFRTGTGIIIIACKEKALQDLIKNLQELNISVISYNL